MCLVFNKEIKLVKVLDFKPSLLEFLQEKIKVLMEQFNLLLEENKENITPEIESDLKYRQQEILDVNKCIIRLSK